MLGFLDSLYAGALALGITRFIDRYSEISEALVSNLAPNAGQLFALFALATACAFVIEDWRHARGVNADYGLRLSPREMSLRFWLDTGSAITAYFLISVSFTDPLTFLLLLSLLLFLGWLWGMLLFREIRTHLRRDAATEYPPNRLGLTRHLAVQLRGERRAYAADYRIKFVVDSHLIGTCITAIAAIILWWTSRHDQQILSVLGPGSSGTSPIVAQLEENHFWLAFGLGTMLPAAGFAALKGLHHFFRGQVLSRLDELQARVLPGAQRYEEAA